MNILLIRPKPHKETIGLQSVMVCEPLELMILSSALKEFGHQVIIVDMILEKKKIEYFVSLYKPDIIGMTGYISHINVIKDYAKRIKKLNCSIKIVVGGVHAEVMPGDFNCVEIDQICKSIFDFLSSIGCK
jgi:hopanoid C-3 methylase